MNVSKKVNQDMNNYLESRICGEVKNGKVSVKVDVTLGRVCVYTTQVDGDGQQRYISFNRIGNKLYGGFDCHWTVKHLLPVAKLYAKLAVKKLPEGWPSDAGQSENPYILCAQVTVNN